METIFKGLPYYLEIEKKESFVDGVEISAYLYNKSTGEKYLASSISDGDSNKLKIATWSAEDTDKMTVNKKFALDIIEKPKDYVLMSYHSDSFALAVASSQDLDDYE